jgi:hypothetical protein
MHELLFLLWAVVAAEVNRRSIELGSAQNVPGGDGDMTVSGKLHRRVNSTL